MNRMIKATFYERFVLVLKILGLLGSYGIFGVTCVSENI